MDRRETARFVPAPDTGPVTARLNPGADVRIVDWSPAGARVEGPCRLRPGSRVRLSARFGSAERVVMCQVTRCVVSQIGPAGRLCYQAGLAFEEPLSMDGAADLGG